ncbi:glycosyltransferase-like domain-containing protein 1 isoform X1 [Periophthalmus magnuspinnatus]|uniref:glycosyltransferase-like domain-containing protein 1 isoform X1 n=1 Tax=Periophthalmus magnuspinnatus TaxID=409849 RepID=UPI00145AE8C1|nr:glycosyltransferase-like domain-containing protein 1 isoform X1 [Periophthalmus magnuspinnatus]
MQEVAGSGPVLLLEPFYGGSHKQLMDLLVQDSDWTLWTLPSHKWHWRARTSALVYSQTLPRDHQYRVLFCSSVLNLCELVALRPDLARLKKILYFHENQLVYPRQKPQHRDFQYGYNQILSCLVADEVVFNSQFNLDSFVGSLRSFLKQIPDPRPQDLEYRIRSKSRVLFFPLDLPQVEPFLPEHKRQRRPRVQDQSPRPETRSDAQSEPGLDSDGGPECAPDQVQPLHIVWPHRWEHDKNPALLFWVLLRLKDRGLDFRVSVLGERFSEEPEVFAESRDLLENHILHWGFLESKDQFYKVLTESDLVLSTAKHEFYGVSMLEAVHCGCFPLVPDALVYPEIFPDQYRYRTPDQLCKKLMRFCKRPDLVRTHTVQVDMSRFSWTTLKPQFLDLLSQTGGT